MIKTLLLLLLPVQVFAQVYSAAEIQRYQTEAKAVKIIRDNWGIPHIYGKTDANAVFGLLFAQCEDDFKRVEMNYVEKLGRLSEVKGEKEIYNDLLIRMVIDSVEARKDYKNSPLWLHKLLDAFADGVNYYLYTHPGTKPALLNHFEPWYALLWTDGSIGAISTAGFGAKDLTDFYESALTKTIKPFLQDSLLIAQNDHLKEITGSVTNSQNEEEAVTGSNGFAFAPSVTENGNSILYINPHVTFYFRPEVQMVSEEGLNTYGAVTWGQFFVYQGFNEHCGWMHTSSKVDVSDAYLEKVSDKNGHWEYEYEHSMKPIVQKTVLLKYKQGNLRINKKFTTFFTHHGPVMAKKNGYWISVRSFNRSILSLEQSWLRTKATSFASFNKVLNMRANTSNNTVYADAEGNIAYWHGNYVPIRDNQYNWDKPVDGTIAATEWKGLHNMNEIVHLINPPNGWLQNCNSTPFTVAGINSPKKENFPAYMAPDGENFRGINAVRVLNKEKKYTLDKVIAAGYDTYLAFFEKLVPALVKAYNSLPENDSLRVILQEPIQMMKNWDLHSGEHSIATSVAVAWGTQLMSSINALLKRAEYEDIVTRTENFAADTSNASILLIKFQAAVVTLKNNYGDWKMEWGEINRFQRINDNIESTFDDKSPSIPVGFTSSQWGQIPSYSSRPYPNTKKMYGVNGNSFICAVEFVRQGNKKIKARSLLAGGESGNPASKHFTDQATMYTQGQFKEVLFYKEDVMKHVERIYHPGE